MKPAMKKRTPLNNYSGNQPLTGGILAAVPISWVPYIQLARLVPPAGLFLIYFPHVFGLLHAALRTRASPAEVVAGGLVLLGGSFFCSNAGHIWNDLIDAPLDVKVNRTKQRPIARGAVTPFAAFIYTLTQVLGAALFIPQLPVPTARAWLYALPSISGSMYYPWAKRHTNYPSLILGFCLAWCIVMGELALGVEPFRSWLSLNSDAIHVDREEHYHSCAIGCLGMATIIWTMIYDTIYAHQDLADDKAAGIKSIAVYYGTAGTKSLLWRLLAAIFVLLVACGWLSGLGLAFYIIAIGGTLASLGSMIAIVDLEDEESCWWWFGNSFWLVGGAIVGGLLTEYVMRMA